MELDDLIQEACLEVFRSLGAFRGESKLRTWVDRIAARVAYRYLSRTRRLPLHLDEPPDISGTELTGEQRALEREAARHLEELLAELDQDYRVAFSLYAIDGHPLREVAEIMNTCVATAKTRVFRARKEVRRRAKTDPALAAYVRGDGS